MQNTDVASVEQRDLNTTKVYILFDTYVDDVIGVYDSRDKAQLAANNRYNNRWHPELDYRIDEYEVQ